LLLVLDSNEYIFAFGIFKKPTCEMLLDTILDTFPAHSIRIPRLILEEVSRHLTPEEFKEFIEFVTNLTTIDEDFVVPFELGVRYELKGLKPSESRYDKCGIVRQCNPVQGYSIVSIGYKVGNTCCKTSSKILINSGS
jgi:hypothetical protein